MESTEPGRLTSKTPEHRARAPHGDSEVIVRRGVWAGLLKQTSFHLFVPGCNVDAVQCASTTGSPPRWYTVRTSEGILVLRYNGIGIYDAPWSIKARMQESHDGVHLIGHMRYMIDRLFRGMWVLYTTILLGFALWLAATEGLGREFVSCLGAAIVIGLVTTVYLALLPGLMRRREARARQILSEMLKAHEATADVQSPSVERDRRRG